MLFSLVRPTQLRGAIARATLKLPVGARTFAVPKKRVSLQRRRTRLASPSKQLKPDPDIVACPTCRAVKKQFVLMHCPGASTPDGDRLECGLKNDTYVLKGPRPKGVASAAKQRQTYRYVQWDPKPKKGGETSADDAARAIEQ